MTKSILNTHFNRSFIAKSLLILFVFICSANVDAQVSISNLSENLFNRSNLLTVSDGNRNLGVVSYEYVVTTTGAERLFVFYAIKADGTIDFANGYNCNANQSITFEQTKGRATRTDLAGTFAGKIFIAADGTVSYTEIANASQATLTPYLLVDKRDNNNHKSYALVKVGKQIWMRENLGAKTFANGVSIATGYSKDDWEATKSPAYTVYDNDEATNLAVMGGLYNWYAVSSDDSLALAPKGWIIPKVDHINVLVEYISPSTFQSAPNEDFSFSFTAGELLKSVDGWTTPPNPGGGTLQPGNNMTMLKFQPFGSTSTSKYFNGYSAKGRQAYFWTADQSEDNEKKATFIRFYWDSQTVNYNFDDKFMGYSVRCLASAPIKIDQNVTTSVDDANIDEQIKILSVQAGNIVIGVPQELIGKTLTVITMYGAEVMHQNITSASVTLDTNLLGKGMYIVRIGSKALKVSL